MYAHVTTYRLGNSAETWADMAEAETFDGVISDQTARTIASWWQAPAQSAIVALSHGLPFDTDELRDEIGRGIIGPPDAEALTAWLDELETLLSV